MDKKAEGKKEGSGDLSKEELISIEHWKKIDQTGKKLPEALDQAVEREYAEPVCPHWQCRQRGIRVIRDNLVVGRPYMCPACRNIYTEEEVSQ